MTILQYKPEHYGKRINLFYHDFTSISPAGQFGFQAREKLEPVLVNEPEYYVNCPLNDYEELPPSAKYGVRYVAREGGKYTKKFIMLELKRKTVQIKGFKSLSTTYIKVQTYNPFINDASVPIVFWVKKDWVEPLTKFATYEDEHKKKALLALKEKWANKK